LQQSHPDLTSRSQSHKLDREDLLAGLNDSLYRCGTVARMSRGSPIREGIANAYRGSRRQTADTHNVECVTPAREREPILIVPLAICKRIARRGREHMR